MIKRVFTLFMLCASVSSHCQAAPEPKLQNVLSPQISERNLPMHDSSRIFFNRVTKRIELPDYATIILVGFDTGKTSQVITEKYDDAKVINYVLRPDFVEYSEMQFPNPRIETRLGDIFHNDKKLKRSADLVFSSWVVGHVPNTKQVLALKSLRHMLKDGGTCGIIFPMKDSEVGRAIDLVINSTKWHNKLENKTDNNTPFRPDQYANLMTRAGFKDVKAEKHVYSVYFNDRSELEDYIWAAASPYLSSLNESEKQNFVTEVADLYLDLVPTKPGGQIPYQVDMVLAVGKNSIPHGQ